jgi:hypothetical protein
MKINLRYLPKRLTRKDKTKQSKELIMSRRLYRKGIYHARPKVESFKSKKSPHITNAEKIYHVDKIGATNALAKATGCSKKALAKIINKGAGAYYSSGSRPNQTAQSWGIARLASSITGGKAAAVDYHILEEGCKSNSKALTLAKRAKKKYGHGTRRVPKVRLLKGGKSQILVSNSFRNIVKKIKEITIDNNIDYEKCGTISKTNEGYILNLHEAPTNTNELRYHCNFEYYEPIIWHSHPTIAKFYPSLEDIIKSIKKKNAQIRYSYIFTKFGFWTMYTINHINVNDELMHEIEQNLNKLYFSTERGRVYISESVNTFIHELNTLLNNVLHISFNPYQE